MAGLSAAVALAKWGVEVELHESAGHAGGRCRSYLDPQLNRRIDNGNHLMLSGNHAIQEYLADIGGAGGLTGPDDAAFPFMDLRTGERWTVRPDRGVIPWSILFGPGRVPGAGLGEYLRACKLVWAGADATVAACLAGPGKLYERFWEPMTVGVMNTPADRAAARPLWQVVKETFGRGAAACRPLMAREGLSEALVDPALRYLESRGAAQHFNRRLRSIEWVEGKAGILRFADDEVPVYRGEAVVLAVSAWVARGLLPDFQGPDTSEAIVNAHFVLPEPRPGHSLIGLVGGTAQWVFGRNDIASVTVSAAGPLTDEDNARIAELLWPEVRAALDLDPALPLPAHRIVKEKRATISQTPDEMRRRPASRTRWPNLFLAGDWTETGLPATIQGAVLSGARAARETLDFLSTP